MTVVLDVEGREAVVAPRDGRFRGSATLDQERKELRVTLRSADHRVERQYRLLRWDDGPWEPAELLCEVSRSGAAVQAYVAWPERGPHRDPAGLAEYRLQPVLLEHEPGDIGQGVFERGFCWPGVVTPGWVAMAAICSNGDPFCFRTYHAGFSDLGYAYCDRDSAVGTWPTGDEPPAAQEAFAAWRATGDPAHFAAGADAIDRWLANDRCPCGGGFAYRNPLRCPTDGTGYVDLADPRRRTEEYYFIQLHGRPIVPLRQP